MAMNRQQKRMLQRQGQVGADGEPVARKRQAPPAARPKPKEERTTPAQFVREVKGEMRKVAWPTRAEVINSSIIVLVALILLTAYIGGLDYGFGEIVLNLFER
ncbi:MAG TPA: preprotein translocase subunit SecE [Acidimicrobiales bacterium]